ncbi:PREDICTED: calcineurin-binding protein cabin-1-like [Papilio xuthus]|uniref:Calcineurin-binding protein cabin-1-like n=1 Tax=Papilio xuthus TaxID=66420 RepID=A0AAJ7EE03_PAPXU|nr:PREDICTED: calcineurin-binding protein cabin-1-like [Papilio xuthus]
MIKISALNDESDEESGSEEEVTREALEQIALQQYAKALDLQRKGNLPDATQLLKDLLDTELLYNVKKPAPGEKASSPLFNLKYLCYKNLAAMQSAADDLEAAIESYIAASELDDTDVTLWHRFGLLCICAKRYETALHAFQRGVQRNPSHWPCIDKIITLLLGLDYKDECIIVIYDALQLDPDYLRGLVYRKYIYKEFPYIRNYMEYLNPIYKWNEDDDEHIDNEIGTRLIEEANEIHKTFVEQQNADQFKCVLPNLKLKKPITSLTWNAIGESLVHMHKYMTENYFSHACYIALIFEKAEIQEKMDICEIEEKEIDSTDNKNDDINTDNEKNVENVSENENNELSDKQITDTEKVESDVELVASESAAETAPEPKVQKKTAVRRRGSALSFLEQWEWCNKRRSGRKKPVNKQDRYDDNIYDTLRRMVPIALSPETIQEKENEDKDTSADLTNLNMLFDEKEKSDFKNEDEYFGSDNEQVDVKEFINKYKESTRDIIDILKDYLSFLAAKWNVKWPEDLTSTFVEANNCYNTHIDVPACLDDNKDDLLSYTAINILAEEITVNIKLNQNGNEKNGHELGVIESIGLILALKPHLFQSTVCLENIIRQLWVKIHVHLLNKCEEFALDSLYHLLCEFEAMGEHHDKYSLNNTNFTFKPLISVTEITEYIKFLERNKKLSTVLELYDKGQYEEVLSIVIDSFEHCKDMAKTQEEEMSLDFAVQLSIILDTCWALDKVETCFKWSLTCLHEALKHYFRFTSGSKDYEKWTMTVVKVLSCMEHILTKEGLNCLESVSQKDLSQALENLIRIIGHQVETNATEMPFGTVAPWIIMHYILQREEDQGRGRTISDNDRVACDEVPNPLMILFIGHEQLGNRSWCCHSDAKLLYFILDTVVPRLRSPSLAKSIEQVCQYMEQCVFCLFGHPGKKTKSKNSPLKEHNVKPHSLDWKRAQQLYEVFRPQILPALEGKVSGITSDVEQLFHRILALLPTECDPNKYLPDLEKYIKGVENKLPTVPPLLPYKMKDIYFLLGDYYFKKEDCKMAIKFNMLDVILNNDRLESWAEISLAKAVHLERVLNSCKNLNNETEFLNQAKSTIQCFKRSLALDPTHSELWLEYGNFVYTVHSFCSRLLKQASESLSMEDFESLERQKEDMLDSTYTCYSTVLNILNNDFDKTNENFWLLYYMLGKVAEKRNKAPSVYLSFYMQGVRSLHETDATYPLKINYSTPTNLCIEVLELHYRIHASILKFIEQHENKPIPASVGKVFLMCIDEWQNGPFSKKSKKDSPGDDGDGKSQEIVHAANILKRSVSDAGEEDTHEAKTMKLEAAAAKVRRSASYDTERVAHNSQKDSLNDSVEKTTKPMDIDQNAEQNMATVKENDEKISEKTEKESKTTNDTRTVVEKDEKESKEKKGDEKSNSENKEETQNKKEESSSSSSSSSSSDSSSSESSTDSSSDSSRDSTTSTKSSNDTKQLTDEEIMKIVIACLDALEDCASRFPPHYKAIYRLAHYHFYYKKGKDIERCRDLMLSNFTMRCGQKLGGLFSERKQSNFFNNIWKIPSAEVERAGSFAFHMNRSVMLTMEILKEIDDHKTLLDLNLHLQRIPDLDKKYLRDSDREELAQQAFSLCVQSLKGQLLKFSQQADLKSNEVERQTLKSLMLDIYRAYQRVQKQPNSKQFTNLLIDAYKLIAPTPIPENANLVDLSMKLCQSHIQTLKQQATMASLDKSQSQQKKPVPKPVEVIKTTPALPPVPVSQTKPDKQPSQPPVSSSGLPKISSHDIAAAFRNYPMINDQLLTQQTAAALSLSYFSKISALAGYTSLQNSLQSSLQSSMQNSFQSEFYRQYFGNYSGFNLPPPKKQKRGPKPGSTRSISSVTAPIKSKSYTSSSLPPSAKSAPTSVITSLQKSVSGPLAPSMGTVLPTLPPSLSANLTGFGVPHTSAHSTGHSSQLTQAHASSSSAPKAPLTHQQVSPGKTLQEKLAERKKHLPASKNVSQEINASISRLPSSLTITKTFSLKNSMPQTKKPEAKKSLAFGEERPKPISSDEVIVLDDD